jgi:uncharacterized membrane protein
VLMFLSTALISLASVKFNSRSLSMAGLVLAAIAPLLTSAPDPDFIGLFSYLMVVVLGTLWIVALTGRRELVMASLLIVALYSLPHLFSPTSMDKGVMLLFVYAFGAVFYLANTAGILKLKDRNIIPDLLTAAGSGFFILAWIIRAAEEEWMSLIIVSWMVVFVLGGFLIFKISRRKEPFFTYAAVGVAMLAAATAVELNGEALIIAYTLEAGLISIFAYISLRSIRSAESVSLLLIVPVIMSLESMGSRAWNAGAFNKDFFVLLVLGATFFGLGLFFSRIKKREGDTGPDHISSILLIAGSVYAYIILWLSLHAEIDNKNTAVMLALVVYTLIGLASYFYGLANSKRGLQVYGGALVGFVVSRLLLIDIWQMDIAGRIITFFLIGALLVSTAFFGKKKIKDIKNNI